MILAYSSEQDVDEYVAQGDALRRPGGAALKKRLRSIRERGFAVNDSARESHFGREIAFPVLARNTEPLGAVMLRFNPDLFTERTLDDAIVGWQAIVSDLTALAAGRPEDFAAPYEHLFRHPAGR